MILACHACHRQLDAGTLEAGARARCFCGALLTVPRRAALAPRMMHCRSCGAALRGQEPRCVYCQAEVALGDRGLGGPCPGCYRRLAADARYCSSCGIHIAPQAALKALQSLECPRCQGRLAECETQDVRFVECTSCGGLWIDERVLEALLSSRGSAGGASQARATSRGAPAAGARDERVRYLACPVCRDRMQRRNVAGSGVIVDWCGPHGYWFDTDELARVLEIGKQHGLMSLRDARPPAGSRTPSEPAAWRPVSRRDDRSFFDTLVDLIDLLR
jgi:Zn-finger nucleic acid-binding protein